MSEQPQTKIYIDGKKRAVAVTDYVSVIEAQFGNSDLATIQATTTEGEQIFIPRDRIVSFKTVVEPEPEHGVGVIFDPATQTYTMPDRVSEQEPARHYLQGSPMDRDVTTDITKTAGLTPDEMAALHRLSAAINNQDVLGNTERLDLTPAELVALDRP